MTVPKGIVHRLFNLGVILKGIDGVLEVIGGLVFSLAQPATLNAMIRFLTAHEISEDPSDWIANLLRSSVEHLSVSSTRFAGAYLLGHGLAKLCLVSGLLRGRHWAYPAALWFLSSFLIYQIYRTFLTHALGLVLLTVLDIGVIWLIWREYQFRKAGLLSPDRPSYRVINMKTTQQNERN